MAEVEFLTRCPNCETSFNVTQVQLNAANGAVRCGACLRIFQGPDHIILKRDDAGASVAASAKQTVASSDADVKASTPKKEAKSPAKKQARRTSKKASKGAAKKKAKRASNKEAGEPPTQGASAEVAEDDSEQQAEAAVEQAAPHGLEAQSEDTLTARAGAALAEQSIDAVAAESVLTEQAEDGLEAQTETAAVHDPEIDLVTDDDLPAGYTGDINVKADPHEIVGTYVEHRSNHFFVWFTLALLASVALMLQFAWFNRDVLSQETQLRDYYLSYCNFAGCIIPEFVDFNALSTTRLVVRTHPQVEHALIVDAIVQNTAGYRQLFPVLQLQFKDSHGKTVASRQFPPGDYLRGELTGLRYIPAKTEVRLSLEIVDPGEQSMGYSMIVVPN